MSRILSQNRIAYQIDSLLIEADSSASSSNAPVTRAAWTCANLPSGLTLSSTGEISGRPTTAGTYDCNVTLSTNWGTATKTIRITVS